MWCLCSQRRLQCKDRPREVAQIWRSHLSTRAIEVYQRKHPQQKSMRKLLRCSTTCCNLQQKKQQQQQQKIAPTQKLSKCGVVGMEGWISRFGFCFEFEFMSLSPICATAATACCRWKLSRGRNDRRTEHEVIRAAIEVGWGVPLQALCVFNWRWEFG